MLHDSYTVPLGNNQKRAFHGSRFSGNLVRLEIEAVLGKSKNITLDFSGVGVVTQSFIDEVIGVLILEHGANVLHSLAFKNCNDDVKSVINYVVNTRIEDTLKPRSSHAH